MYVSVAPRNVDRLCRPDLAARDTRGYPRNGGDLLIGLNDRFSTDVVTSYDASYFHSHTVFLLLCRRLFIDLAFFLLSSFGFGSVYRFRLDIHQCVELGETATSPARRRNQGEAFNSTRTTIAGRTIPSGGGDLVPPSVRK